MTELKEVLVIAVSRLLIGLIVFLFAALGGVLGFILLLFSMAKFSGWLANF